VGGKEQDGISVIEDRLGSVAVMEIPIDDENPPETQAFQNMTSRDCRIVEHTESRRMAPTGMMARGADKGKGVIDLTGHDRVCRGEAAAHGKPGCVIGLSGGLRIGIEDGRGLSFSGGNQIDIEGTVDKGEVIIGRKSWRDGREFALHVGLAQHQVKRFETFRSLGREMHCPVI